MKLLALSTLLFLSTSLVGCSTGNQNPISINANRAVGTYYKKGKKKQCANFVSDILSKSGINYRSSYAQDFCRFGKKVSFSELRNGDILLFQGTYNGPNRITHIGFYQDGCLIHRPTFSAPVQKEPIENYKKYFAEARRYYAF
jgi:cell wall-associated NlpC family hydrolase